MFLIIVGSIVVGNIVWWRWAHRRARTLAYPLPWQIAIGINGFLQLGYIVLFFVAPGYARQSHIGLPMAVLAWMYLWDLIVMPMAVIAIGARALLQRRSKVPAEQSDLPAITRRQWLSATAIAVPPLLATGLTARAISQLGLLRVREIDVPVAGLPGDLEGLTIAQVSDTHIGRFTRPKALEMVVEMTNQLRADLVVFTGDLIDLSLGDLPAGIDMIKRLDPRQCLVMIEGNHDLIDDPDAFESRVKAAGLPMLLDDTRTIKVRGIPMQFLGIRWGNVTDGPKRKSNNAVIRDSVTRVLAQRDASAFPILLAHHPHAFDKAIEAQIPLTLSGHTHGGQIMLTERLGAGPVMFRYWSGLYQSAKSSLVVSNGAGNWFPLRVNAPAEIVMLTLRKT